MKRRTLLQAGLAAPSMVDGVPQFELYSCPTYNQKPSLLVENFQVALDHYFESQGRTPVLYKPVEFTFYAGNGPWLESDKWSAGRKVVGNAHDIFEKRVHEGIQAAVDQQAMSYFHASGRQAVFGVVGGAAEASDRCGCPVLRPVALQLQICRVRP